MITTAVLNNSVASRSAGPAVFIMKDGGLNYILDLIKNAKQRIYIKVYIFTDVDGQITDELIKAKARGVSVCVMIEPDPFYWTEDKFNPSWKIVKKLKQSGIDYRITNPYFEQDRTTHEKSLIIDNTGIILTGNLSKSNFTENMDMGVALINNPETVAQMASVFLADWNRSGAYSFKNDRGLVISPYTVIGNKAFTAKDRIIGLICSATNSVHVLNQSLQDKDVLNALVAQKQKGLEVYVILEDPNKVETNQAAIMFLQKNGVTVGILKKPYLHAKAVSSDAQDNTPENNFSFVGSQNFTTHGLTKNREMGLIFYDPQAQVERVFRYCSLISSDAGRTYLLSSAEFKNSVVELINLSKKSVTVAADKLDDKVVIDALTKAKERGVKIKIIVRANNKIKNSPLARDIVYDTEQKVSGSVVVFDEKISILAPVGFASRGFASRGIDAEDQSSFEAAISCDAEVVADLGQNIDRSFCSGYMADAKQVLFNKNSYDCKTKILELINNARTTIFMESTGLNDKDIIKALMAKAKRGVFVKILLKDTKENKKTQDYLKNSGIYVELLSGITSESNILLIDSTDVFISSVSFDKLSQKGVLNNFVLNNETQVATKAHENFDLRYKIASFDQAKSKIYFKADVLNNENDEKIIAALTDIAKKGVKVTIEVNDITPEMEFKIEKMKESKMPIILIKSGKVKKGEYLFNVDGKTVINRKSQVPNAK